MATVENDDEQVDPTNGNGSNEHDYDMAELSVETLQLIFAGKDTMLMSNAAVAALLAELLDRYRKRESPRDRTALLLHWKKDHKRLKRALEDAASEDKLLVEGGDEFAHLTEEKTKSLMGRVCPADPYLPDPAPPRRRKSVR